MDYVDADAPGKTCNVQRAEGHYYSCLHGGEKRVLALPGLADCKGVLVKDDLGAFDWTCEVSAGQAHARSISLRPGKGLSDLVAISAGVVTFKENRVVVQSPLGELKSSSSIWWSNPIEILAAGAPISSSGRIYVLQKSVTGRLESSASKVALIAAPGVIVRPGKVACEANPRTLAAVKLSGNFSWFEGMVVADADPCYAAVSADGRFSVVNVSSLTALDCGVLAGPRSLVRWTSIRREGPAGMGRGLCINGPGAVAANIWVYGSGNSSFGLTTGPAATSGFVLSAAISGFDVGVFQSFGSYVMSGLTLVGNKSGFSKSGGFLALSNVSIANNLWDGARVDQAADRSVAASNLLLFNNGIGGINCGERRPISSLSAALAIQNGEFGVRCSGASADGHLVALGNGSSQCMGDVCSQFKTTVANPADYTNPFVSPSMPSQSMASETVEFWRGLDGKPVSSPHQVWALAPGASFPGTGRGACTFGRMAGEQCLLWDFTLRRGTGAVNQTAGPTQEPTGGVHRWVAEGAVDADDCPSRFPGSKWEAPGSCFTRHLKHAVEIVGDEVGNENALCESNESCIFSPNVGSYQGHGDLASSEVFANAEFSGIRLFRYPQNGR